MSKLKFLIVAIMTIILCSCSNEDNNLSLENTTWKAVKQNETSRMESELKFYNEKFFFNMIYINGNGDGIIADGTTIVKEYFGTYSIEGNIVSLSIPSNLMQDTAIIHGTINGNAICFPKTDKFNEIIFYKQ